jgi:hypothetical protein
MREQTYEKGMNCNVQNCMICYVLFMFLSCSLMNLKVLESSDVQVGNHYDSKL